MLKKRLFAASLLTAITLTMAMVPGAFATSLKWFTPFTLDCSYPGFLDGGTSATGVVKLYGVKAKVATTTVSCAGSDIVSGAINTKNDKPTSYELWVYIYAGSTLEATCYSGLQNYYPNILYCSSSIYGGATLTLSAPYQAQRGL